MFLNLFTYPLNVNNTISSYTYIFKINERSAMLFSQHCICIFLLYFTFMGGQVDRLNCYLLVTFLQ